MSKLDDVLNTIDNDAKSFFSRLASLNAKARQTWILISSQQTRNIMLQLANQAVKTVRDAGAAVAANGSAPAAPITLALDAAVVDDIKTLIADAKAGDGVILADLKVLGLTL